MEIEANTLEKRGEQDPLNEELEEIPINGRERLEEIDQNYESLKDFNDSLQGLLKIMQAELNSKEAYLKFQKSYIETQKSNQAKLEKLTDHCDNLQKTLETLNETNSSLIHKKSLISKKLEEKKVFFYSTLKKEQNSKTLLNSIQSKISTLSLEKAQIINSIREDQLQSIDHRVIITNKHLAPKSSQEPSKTSKPSPTIPLTVILVCLIILNLIY